MFILLSVYPTLCLSYCLFIQVDPRTSELYHAYHLGIPRTVAKFQIDTFSSIDSGKLLDSKVILLELTRGDRAGLKVGDRAGLKVGDRAGLRVGDRAGLKVGERKERRRGR